jgi:hypothetical protein
MADVVNPLTVISVTSANVGTKLATGADTKITGITITQPPANADQQTPLTLLDLAAAPAGPTYSFARTLFNAALSAFGFLYAYKPVGPSMAPGLTNPSWPQAFLTGNIPFTNGIYVASCPAGVTFSITTGP